MAYARKTRKGRGGLKKRISWQKSSGSNQKKQIYTLAKRVSQLSKVQRSRAIYGRFSRDWEKLVEGDYIVQNLTDVSMWTPIFENPEELADRQKVKLLSIGIDTMITCASEPSPITMTYFIVSLKPGQGAKHLVESTGEGLANLEPGEHYSFLQGMAQVNKKYFQIHKCKRFTVTAEDYTNTGNAGKNQLGTFKRFYQKISFPRWLNDGQEKWSGINTSSVPLGARLYCLIFNDNSIVDLESPQLRQNIVATVKA